MLAISRCRRLNVSALLQRGVRWSSTVSGRSYNDAVRALNGLQSNYAVVDAIRRSGQGMNRQAIPEMIEWLRRVGYKPHDFDAINTVHIAGTKGKGSTAAFVSSILFQYAAKGVIGDRVGLYTSPHLRSVCERIQVNNQPILEPLFAESFFEIWDRLESSAPRYGLASDQSAKPVYFRYLTLMALHLFLKEKVASAVIECGIGGEYDSTNILQAPTATGIASLGIDHTAMLGSTIEEIAWHKAGIMKTGAPAFTVEQPSEALAILQSRAKERQVDLRVVGLHRQIEDGSAALGLDGEFQKTNASLAVELAASHLRSMGVHDVKTDRLPEEFLRGLRDVRWAGRWQTREEPGLTWHIDGGHTLESIKIVGEWFKDLVKRSASCQGEASPPRILLFNQQTRAAMPLMRELVAIVSEAFPYEAPFTHAVFCTNITFASSGYKADLVSVNVSQAAVDELEVQKELALGWQRLVPEGKATSNVHVLRTIEDAVTKCRKIASEWFKQHPSSVTTRRKPKVLATGSLHLVGGLLEILESQY